MEITLTTDLCCKFLLVVYIMRVASTILFMLVLFANQCFSTQGWMAEWVKKCEKLPIINTDIGNFFSMRLNTRNMACRYNKELTGKNI